ncbi:MAG: bifunctional phosphoribosyl-AMP cyclohydrolase/phosphoribosyl-ATP diphosphatase HisIE [Bacteroidales bacterium]|nr:bifunctional phosphoribosyl-AMP cyclohydrolase/phosphoribosyl-ATP diphosphatase HisIE [Bacteroidales bacterium]
MLQFSDLNSAKQPDGLIPVIVQDDLTLRVLMLGYMNAEALLATQQTGKVTFYSRTRQCLWTKGETSGNYLDVVSITPDCDRDTLLIRAIPQGPTCHTGAISCFDSACKKSEGFIRQLQQVVKERHEQMPEGSYTTKLYTKGVNKIAQKVGEEAVETVIEAVRPDFSRYDFIYEASDLIYHLLVLLEERGCSISDLESELLSRHK